MMNPIIQHQHSVLAHACWVRRIGDPCEPGSGEWARHGGGSMVGGLPGIVAISTFEVGYYILVVLCMTLCTVFDEKEQRNTAVVQSRSTTEYFEFCDGESSCLNWNVVVRYPPLRVRCTCRYPLVAFVSARVTHDV